MLAAFWCSEVLHRAKGPGMNEYTIEHPDSEGLKLKKMENKYWFCSFFEHLFPGIGMDKYNMHANEKRNIIDLRQICSERRQTAENKDCVGIRYMVFEVDRAKNS